MERSDPWAGLEQAQQQNAQQMAATQQAADDMAAALARVEETAQAATSHLNGR